MHSLNILIIKHIIKYVLKTTCIASLNILLMKRYKFCSKFMPTITFSQKIWWSYPTWWHAFGNHWPKIVQNPAIHNKKFKLTAVIRSSNINNHTTKAAERQRRKIINQSYWSKWKHATCVKACRDTYNTGMIGLKSRTSSKKWKQSLMSVTPMAALKSPSTRTPI